MVKKIIISLIFIGILLRVYKIGEIPSGLFADEIALAINAKTIAQEGTDEFGRRFPFGFESFGDYKMPGYIYTTSLAYKLLGPEVLTVRFVALLASLFSIPLIGYLAYILFPSKRELPYFAMLMLALSPYHIHFSRIAYETMLATTFLLLYLIALVQAVRTQEKVWILLGSIAIFASSWTYPAPRFLIPVLTVTVCAFCLIAKPFHITRKITIRTFVIFFLTLGISFIPSLLSPIMDKRPLGYLLEGHNWQTALVSWLRIWDFEFLFMKGDWYAFRHGTKEVGLFFSIFAIPLMLGIVHVIKKFAMRDFSMIFLLLLLVIFGLPSALTFETPYAPRLLPMIIPLSLLLALGIDRVVSFLDQIQKRIKLTVYFFLLLVLFFQITLYAHIYFVHFEQKSLPEFPLASIAMSKYVEKELIKNPGRKIYFLNGISCLPLGYNELKFWYLSNLSNENMIAWNNMFREQRLETNNLFGSYGRILHMPYSFDNIQLNPGQNDMTRAPSGSLLVRCAIHKEYIDEKKEKIKGIFYMYRQQRDAVYIITEKN